MKTIGLATVLAFLLAATAVAATDENTGISIEKLLKDGWQIAGYAASNQFAVESAIRFRLRHEGESYLVQCRGSFDVTRSPSVTSLATSCASATRTPPATSCVANAPTEADAPNKLVIRRT